MIVPQAHFEICKAAQVPTVGNAAGNAIDWLDLSGQNSPPAPLPAGFTRRGIIALIISIFNGVLGTAILVWYSYRESNSKVEEERGLISGRDAEQTYNEIPSSDSSPDSRIPTETARLLNH